MLTKTIGQLSAATSIADADLIEIEQGGVSKYGTVTMLETNLITGNIATTAQSLLGSSNSTLMTPAQVREATNSANGAAPIYGCRAWVRFDGTTVSSSITGTYSRGNLTTTTVIVATGHGCITGNVQYLDFTSGTASDNSYVVTYVDDDTFSVTTVSTSSTLGAVTIKRCPVNASGNVNNVSYNIATAGSFFVNFAVAMPSEYYGMAALAVNNGGAAGNMVWLNALPTAQSMKIVITNDASTETDQPCGLAVFA